MTTTLTPNLMTEDVNASIDFYCNRLGFRFIVGVPTGSEEMVSGDPGKAPLRWAMLQREEASLMFQARDSLAEEAQTFSHMPLGASATFYLEVANLDSLLEHVGEHTEVVVPERVTFYGMREVWIRDNNGYVLTLAEKAARP